MTRFFFSVLLLPFLGFSQEAQDFDSAFLMGQKEDIISAKHGLLPQVEIAFLQMQRAAKKDSSNFRCSRYLQTKNKSTHYEV